MELDENYGCTPDQSMQKIRQLTSLIWPRYMLGSTAQRFHGDTLIVS
jgi:hypothetical protein